MTALIAFGCGVVGLVAGTFLNVVIDRVPSRDRVLPPYPQCNSCGSPAPSWLAAMGRCRRCRLPLGARRGLVEVASAALLAAAGIRFAGSTALPAYCVFFASLLVITVIDLDHFIIPNRVIYPTLAATIPLLLVAAAIADDWGRARTAAIGGVGGFLALFVVHTVSPRGMGFGDVRLAGVIGMMLGWLGLGYVALSLFLSFLLASVVGIFLLATRIRGRKDAVPFGPFMAAGAVIAALWGSRLLDAYVRSRG
ncbi:MAG: A24 family peptidase [Acidimicrobiales bacterium]